MGIDLEKGNENSMERDGRKYKCLALGGKRWAGDVVAFFKYIIYMIYMIYSIERLK